MKKFLLWNVLPFIIAYRIVWTIIVPTTGHAIVIGVAFLITNVVGCIEGTKA